ncbi:deaminase [Arcobacter sp. CECT 8983]|uniref:Rid family detoxifying hydrolase n=1 Tax=Arcobacter sp. CECT 8983 TaxID=2044508 RepID=UPI00100C313A|nr:Rid family detoxifying hydrolase [Arcobacter sp. CECT 8983]RXJ89652.1 deaminase [Arcobacter sp. CECT 8983]
MEKINSKKLPAAIGPYSQAVKANGLIYTSGQVPLDVDGNMVERDIKVQTRQVFENLRNLLDDALCGMDNVIKITIYLENMEDFGVVNVLCAEAFGEHKPVRTTISAKGLPMNSMIVIDAIAQPYDYY